MVRTCEPELLDRLNQQNEMALRRARRLLDFLKVVHEREVQLLSAPEEMPDYEFRTARGSPR